jgi:hypothetical protein
MIALTIVVCLSLGTFGLAEQKNSSSSSTSNLPILKWERSIKTRILLGNVIGLAGVAVAITNKERDIKGDNAALGAALLGFGYAFWNWTKLQLAARQIQITKIMRSWIGQHESELIASWGPPSRIMPDGKGGTVLDYSHYKGLGQTGYIDPWGRIYTSPTGYKATRLFYVDNNGIVYNFKWQGL